MRKNIYIFLLLCGVVLLSVPAAKANPFALDTIQREMILQRDYQPVAQQAEKAFFNPFQTSGTTALKPVSFARNTYPIAMNVTPRLFSPLDNPLAPEQIKQKFHARLFGGIPGHVGANIGVLTKTSEVGTLLISVDHLSRFVNVPQLDYLPLSPKDHTHDTEIALDYSHAMSERVFNIGLDLFHHLHTFYGTFPNTITLPSQLTATYPLHKMVGGEVCFGVTPSPLSLARGLQYSIDGKVGYTNKDDISFLYGKNDVIIPNSGNKTGGNKVSELSLDVAGNLGYLFAGTDFGVGVDANYEMISISELSGIAGNQMNPVQVLSVDPYVSYTAPYVVVKAGARLQLLNIGSRKFLVTPDVQARFRASDNFSIYLNADGGAEYHTLREIYRQNRWADALSVYDGYDIAQYRVMAGVQVGNINGFSLDINGGYTSYADFADWRYGYHITNFTNELIMDGSNMDQIYTPLFGLRSAGAASNIFVGVKARYISPEGLDLGASFQMNNYKSINTAQEIEKVVGYGRPAFEIGVSADYSVNDKLGINLNFTGLGGIKSPAVYVPVGYGIPGNILVDEETSFIADLGARISYKVHPNIGLSLIGENLLNQTTARWRGYNRQGATAVVAATFIF